MTLLRFKIFLNYLPGIHQVLMCLFSITSMNFFKHCCTEIPNSLIVMKHFLILILFIKRFGPVNHVISFDISC